MKDKNNSTNVTLTDLQKYINYANKEILISRNIIEFKKLSKDICVFFKCNFLSNNYDPNFVDNFVNNLKKRLFYQYLLERRLSKLKRRFLFKNGKSISQMKIKKSMLENVIDKVEYIKDKKIRTVKYNIYKDFNLINYLYRNYVPLVIDFLGIENCLPIIDANIRFNNSSLFGNSYINIFKNGKFDNLHYDEDVFSIPLIVYLSNVTKGDGPFEYIQNSENQRGGPLDSAIKDLVSHDNVLEQQFTDNCNHIKNIEYLPIELRQSSSIIHHHFYEGQNKPHNYKMVLGDIGTSIMFHGYNLLHGGGMPLDGERLSILFNLKFPSKKIFRKLSQL